MNSPSRTDRSRTQILDAANAAFGELGFADTSVDEIARRAGLTRKTAYNLFGSKTDIALALIARVEAQGEGLYRPRLAARDNAISLLEDILGDSAQWCLAHPSIACLALAPAVRPGQAPPEDRPSFQRLVRDCLALGQSQGLIRTDEEADFLALVVLGLYGQAMLNALAGEQFDGNQIARLIRIVVEGIGPRDA